jgi:hypothetical protein
MKFVKIKKLKFLNFFFLIGSFNNFIGIESIPSELAKFSDLVQEVKKFNAKYDKPIKINQMLKEELLNKYPQNKSLLNFSKLEINFQIGTEKKEKDSLFIITFSDKQYPDLSLVSIKFFSDSYLLETNRLINQQCDYLIQYEDKIIVIISFFFASKNWTLIKNEICSQYSLYFDSKNWRSGKNENYKICSTCNTFCLPSYDANLKKNYDTEDLTKLINFLKKVNDFACTEYRFQGLLNQNYDNQSESLTKVLIDKINIYGYNKYGICNENGITPFSILQEKIRKIIYSRIINKKKCRIKLTYNNLVDCNNFREPKMYRDYKQEWEKCTNLLDKPKMKINDKFYGPKSPEEYDELKNNGLTDGVFTFTIKVYYGEQSDIFGKNSSVTLLFFNCDMIVLERKSKNKVEEDFLNKMCASLLEHKEIFLKRLLTIHDLFSDDLVLKEESAKKYMIDDFSGEIKQVEVKVKQNHQDYLKYFFQLLDYKNNRGIRLAMPEDERSEKNLKQPGDFSFFTDQIRISKKNLLKIKRWIKVTPECVKNLFDPETLEILKNWITESEKVLNDNEKIIMKYKDDPEFLIKIKKEEKSQIEQKQEQNEKVLKNISNKFSSHSNVSNFSLGSKPFKQQTKTEFSMSSQPFQPPSKTKEKK